MSDWVNWQQFSDLNATDVQRQADEASAARAAQQAQMDASLHGLSTQANQAAREGTFQGVQALGSYGDVMKQRQQAETQQAKSGMAAGALAKPAWESDLTAGKAGTFESPWAKLGQRLGAGANKAAQQNTATLRARQAAEQKAEQERFNAEAKAKNEAAMHGKRNSEADAYAKWSDAVNRSSASSGGPGAGAYYDAAAGTGPQPVTLYSSPLTKKTQKTGYATPTNPDSNFGLNSGYSSGNDWNF